jgi:hypothetical protein
LLSYLHHHHHHFPYHDYDFCYHYSDVNNYPVLYIVVVVVVVPFTPSHSAIDPWALIMQINMNYHHHHHYYHYCCCYMTNFTHFMYASLLFAKMPFVTYTGCMWAQKSLKNTNGNFVYYNMGILAWFSKLWIQKIAGDFNTKISTCVTGRALKTS